MEMIYSLTNRAEVPLALTIGNFDGVHIGHQAIINKLVNIADKKQIQPAVMTFSPNAKVFFGESSNFLISSDQEKAEQLAQRGVKWLFQIPFDLSFSQIPAIDFVELLIHRLHINYLLVGDDFRFGYQGQGDYHLLEKLCAKHHIGLQHTPTLHLEHHRVSSSRVRQAIKHCEFDLVAQLLGRRLSYQGKVIKGQQLGRTLDFPTANIHLPSSRLLPRGVFVVQARIQGEKKSYSGMCNIGVKPTVSQKKVRQIEVHLFDFNNDLYGKELIIEPIQKIRDEQTFNSLEALAKQLHQDKTVACSILKEGFDKPSERVDFKTTGVQKATLI